MKKDSSSSLLFAYAKSKFTTSTENLSQKIMVICTKTACAVRTSLVGALHKAPVSMLHIILTIL